MATDDLTRDLVLQAESLASRPRKPEGLTVAIASREPAEFPHMARTVARFLWPDRAIGDVIAAEDCDPPEWSVGLPAAAGWRWSAVTVADLGPLH